MELIPAKTILTRTSHPDHWFGYEYNMNLYKGCCHGCIYCDSRCDCYRVENFDRVRAKDGALELLSGELRRKRKTGVIGTGAMSDPYNPFEAEYQLTRGALELINGYKFGINMLTKSDLVTRDIDLYKEIQTHSPVCVKLTITAFDDNLCRKIEPGTAVASKRFRALKALADQGIYTGILLMPVLPFITDNKDNIEAIVQAAHMSSVKFIYPGFGVTLRQNQKTYYYDCLDRLFPGLRARYQTVFGSRYECEPPDAGDLWQTFSALCERYGILYKMPDIIAAYRTWGRQGQEAEIKQMSLF